MTCSEVKHSVGEGDTYDEDGCVYLGEFTLEGHVALVVGKYGGLGLLDEEDTRLRGFGQGRGRCARDVCGFFGCVCRCGCGCVKS